MSGNISGNCLALHAIGQRSSTSRWVLSAAVIVSLHAGAVAAALALQASNEQPGAQVAAIMIDMAPAAASPHTTPLDLAPGPEMQQAEAASPPPEPEPPAAVAPQIAPTPPQVAAEVALPPPDKAEPTAKPPERSKQKTVRTKPDKPRQLAKLQPSEQAPAPRTSAAPRAERSAPTLTGSIAGAQAAMTLPSYRALLAAHLQRFKQYPSASRAAGEQGTAMLSFVVARNGRVLSSRLASSSGYGALDAETMAMIQRAQPLPSFPDDLPHASMSFSVPVRFSVR
jgi:protein TonB